MKKKFILLPITLTALSPAISLVGCGDPTEQPEMVITKSSDTVMWSKEITITVTSTTQGNVVITSARPDDDNLIITINENKIIVSISDVASEPWDPHIVTISINAECNGIKMKEQDTTLIWHSNDYEILNTEEYVEEDNAIYTKKSKEINVGESKYLAIEYNLSEFKNDENLNNANNNMCFLLPENTTLEIGKETSHDFEWCKSSFNGSGYEIPNACETVLDSSGNFQFYYLNKETFQEETGHDVSLNDTIYLFVKITNTGAESGLISSMYK